MSSNLHDRPKPNEQSICPLHHDAPSLLSENASLRLRLSVLESALAECRNAAVIAGAHHKAYAGLAEKIDALLLGSTGGGK